jgi:hypothetical protein
MAQELAAPSPALSTSSISFIAAPRFNVQHQGHWATDYEKTNENERGYHERNNDVAIMSRTI